MATQSPTCLSLPPDISAHRSFIRIVLRTGDHGSYSPEFLLIPSGKAGLIEGIVRKHPEVDLVAFLGIEKVELTDGFDRGLDRYPIQVKAGRWKCVQQWFNVRRLQLHNKIDVMRRPRLPLK